MTPAAVLAIDLVGFTRTQADRGTDAAEVRVKELRECVAGAVFRDGKARVIEEIGDACILTCPSIRSARRIADDVQRHLRYACKAGIGYGELEKRETGWYGAELIAAVALAENEPQTAETGCLPGEVRLTEAAARIVRRTIG